MSKSGVVTIIDTVRLQANSFFASRLETTGCTSLGALLHPVWLEQGPPTGFDRPPHCLRPARLQNPPSCVLQYGSNPLPRLWHLLVGPCKFEDSSSSKQDLCTACNSRPVALHKFAVTEFANHFKFAVMLWAQGSMQRLKIALNAKLLLEAANCSL